MKKEKSMKIFISKDLSSDEEENDIEKYKEYQFKPKIRKEDYNDYIHLSDDEESSQKRITPKKEKLSKKPNKSDRNNKKISQKITQKNLVQEDEFRKLRKKAEILGADSLDYSKRKNYKYVVEYNDKKIQFGSTKTEDYITHQDKDRRQKYLNKAKKIKDKDGRLTHELPFYPNYWSVNLLNRKKFLFKKIISLI